MQICKYELKMLDKVDHKFVILVYRPSIQYSIPNSMFEVEKCVTPYAYMQLR